MIMLIRVLRTEFLKLKRTLALWMVVVAPVVVVLLQFLVGYKGGERLSQGNDAWPAIVRNSVALWTILMMPLFVTLETSLLAGLEHTDKNWKTLLALPAPRWTIYASKLIVTIETESDRETVAA
ncbi:MAG: ABC transporter permease, partial [Bryobacteraceae bacterium]